MSIGFEMHPMQPLELEHGADEEHAGIVVVTNQDVRGLLHFLAALVVQKHFATG